MTRSSTITGNSSAAVERHIGSSYKTVLMVSKYLNEIQSISTTIESGAFGSVFDNMDSIIVLSGMTNEIEIVAGISEETVIVANAANDVIAVSTNLNDVIRVRESIDEIVRVSQSADNLDRVHTSIANLDRVFASIDNIDIVVNQSDTIDVVATNIAQVIATGDSILDVNTVAANLAAVINVSMNMADVVQASVFVDDIHTSVAAAQLSEANALASAQASEVSNQESAVNAASTAADKSDVTLMRDEMESDRAEVELNTAQVSADAAIVADDKVATEGYRNEAEAARLEAQRWATGISGSGVSVPSDTNNAHYYSEVARNNANQTFKSGGYFTPTLGQEYPDVTGVEVDTVWLVKFASASTSYTYTTGDLAGETLENGFMLIYDTPQDTFDFIPTTLTGANSVNGVNPDTTGNVTIVAANISDVFSETEVLAITNALAARATALESTTADHSNRLVSLETQQAINTDDITSLQSAVASNDTELADHESRITTNTNNIDANAVAISNLQTSKADADTVIVKSHGTTGGIDVPRWADNASRPDMTGVDKAVFGFNDSAEESELWNPVTNEWGGVGGGGIPPVKEVKTASFAASRNTMYGVNIGSGEQVVISVEAGLATNSWEGAGDYGKTLDSNTHFTWELDGEYFAQKNSNGEYTNRFTFDARNGWCVIQKREDGYWDWVYGLYGTDAEYFQKQLDVSKQVFHVVDYQAPSVTGGSSVAGGEQQRNLTDVIENTVEGASFNPTTKTFILPKGKFAPECVKAPACLVGRHRIILRNAQTNEVIALGDVNYSYNNSYNTIADGTQNWSEISSDITLTEATEIKVMHKTQLGYPTYGLGVQSDDEFNSIFTQVKFRRVE